MGQNVPVDLRGKKTYVGPVDENREKKRCHEKKKGWGGRGSEKRS